MRGTCVLNVAPICDSPDDPRYEPCGKPAVTWEKDDDGTKAYLCADHADELENPRYDRPEDFLDQV